ncbi:DUF6059 family protein [Streptomyces bungoensis]|uniref:DUF6059 family protein n=1 Tax=Streptomyces bungoensis TaxID=285568 RepID=UPI0033EEEAF0
MDGTSQGGIVRGLVRGALAVYRVLVVYGALWVAMPDDQMRVILGPGPGPQPGSDSGPASGVDRPGAASDGAASPTRPRRRAVRHPARRMTGPPPGHPERLRDDIPLTPLERRLRRELGLG